MRQCDSSSNLPSSMEPQTVVLTGRRHGGGGKAAHGCCTRNRLRLHVGASACCRSAVLPPSTPLFTKTSTSLPGMAQCKMVYDIGKGQKCELLRDHHASTHNEFTQSCPSNHMCTMQHDTPHMKRLIQDKQIRRLSKAFIQQYH